LLFNSFLVVLVESFFRTEERNQNGNNSDSETESDDAAPSSSSTTNGTAAKKARLAASRDAASKEVKPNVPLEMRAFFVEVSDMLKTRRENGPNSGSVPDTIKWFKANLPEYFQDFALELKTCQKWRGQIENIHAKEKESLQKAQEARKKSGGKRGPLSGSVFEFTTTLWKNAKAPLLVLVTIWQCLSAQRDAGVPLSMPIIAPLIIGILMANKIDWVPSRSWMWNFVTKRCNLSVRAATQDARKIPSNYDTIRKFYILRFVWLQDKFNLRPSLIYNFDETGSVFFPVAKKTYNKKGAKDVGIQNTDEKRQFTLTPIISMAGEFISKIQIIWQGTTSGCCPQPAIQEKFKGEINHTFSESHWSVPRTVIELVDSIYEDHAKEQLEKFDADAGAAGSTYWCIVLDVYSSHIARTTIDTLKAKYPTLILYFVPPSCTPLLQPLDSTST